MSSSTCVFTAVMAVLAALAVATTHAAPAADTALRQKRSSAPDVSGLEDWKSIGDSSLCPAVVSFNRQLRVNEVWCRSEGEELDARDAKYVCTTLRYTLPVDDSDADIAGGCVALMSHVAEVDANRPTTD